MEDKGTYWFMDTLIYASNLTCQELCLHDPGWNAVWLPCEKVGLCNSWNAIQPEVKRLYDCMRKDVARCLRRVYLGIEQWTVWMINETCSRSGVQSRTHVRLWRHMSWWWKSGGRTVTVLSAAPQRPNDEGHVDKWDEAIGKVSGADCYSEGNLHPRHGCSRLLRVRLQNFEVEFHHDSSLSNSTQTICKFGLERHHVTQE